MGLNITFRLIIIDLRYSRRLFIDVNSVLVDVGDSADVSEVHVCASETPAKSPTSTLCNNQRTEIGLFMKTESVFCEVDEFKVEELGYDGVQSGI
jgi:hypothetical protein